MHSGLYILAKVHCTTLDLIFSFNLHGVSYPLFVFFYNLLKLQTFYIKFLPVVAEEILIRNI